jgi:hypothetical protein
MQNLKASPFKVNISENDPKAFGLRTKEIIECSEAIFNYRSLLISGPRGIGKSSLGEQIQIILDGNPTLLKRCNFNATFTSTFCVYYACGPDVSLTQLVTDLISAFEDTFKYLPKIKIPEIK